MKRTLLPYLRCLKCSKTDWEIRHPRENALEIRSGELVCRFCGKCCPVEDGIVRMFDALPEEVAREKRHAESFDYLKTADGRSFPINTETLGRFADVFLSLPRGDGSSLFQPGGSFDNQAGNAERFYRCLEMLRLTGRERVLEVGSSFTWGAWHFARRGCETVALDVTNYLLASDLYLGQHNGYYDRVMADMSNLPFSDGSFDLIFSHSVIHHAKDLTRLFKEFARILRPGGRVAALHECAFGVFEDKSGRALQQAIEEGFNENAYTLPQWKRGACSGGFRKVDIVFFPFVDDYIHRKELRRSPETAKLKMARWIRAHAGINAFLNLLSRWPRILFRPKAWMLIARKG